MTSSIKIVSQNKKASFNYTLGKKYIAGIVLSGSEVKSVKNNRIQISGSYIRIVKDRVFLINSDISHSQEANLLNKKIESKRDRELLLTKKEINTIKEAEDSRKSHIPIEVILKNGLVKIIFAEALGKKNHDKRETIKRKEFEREKARILK